MYEEKQHHPPTAVMDDPRGHAVRPDGTLKEAHEMDFPHSRSASPIDLSADFPCAAPAAPSPIPASLPPTVASAIPKKQKQNPRGSRPLTAAVQPPKKRHCLTFTDKIEILDFSCQEEKGWSQKKIAGHFKTKFPNLHQTTVGDIL